MTYILKDKNSGTYLKYCVLSFSARTPAPVFDAFQIHAQRYLTRKEAEEAFGKIKHYKMLKMKIIRLRPPAKLYLNN